MPIVKSVHQMYVGTSIAVTVSSPSIYSSPSPYYVTMLRIRSRTIQTQLRSLSIPILRCEARGIQERANPIGGRRGAGIAHWICLHTRGCTFSCGCAPHYKARSTRRYLSRSLPSPWLRTACIVCCQTLGAKHCGGVERRCWCAISTSRFDWSADPSRHVTPLLVGVSAYRV